MTKNLKTVSFPANLLIRRSSHFEWVCKLKSTMICSNWYFSTRLIFINRVKVCKMKDESKQMGLCISLKCTNIVPIYHSISSDWKFVQFILNESHSVELHQIIWQSKKQSLQFDDNNTKKRSALVERIENQICVVHTSLSNCHQKYYNSPNDWSFVETSIFEIKPDFC